MKSIVDEICDARIEKLVYECVEDVISEHFKYFMRFERRDVDEDPRHFIEDLILDLFNSCKLLQNL